MAASEIQSKIPQMLEQKALFQLWNCNSTKMPQIIQTLDQFTEIINLPIQLLSIKCQGVSQTVSGITCEKDK